MKKIDIAVSGGYGDRARCMNWNAFMMRLTGTLVLLTVLFVMGFAATSEAQRVTVDRTAAELRTVLADIRKQTGFAVVAPDRLLRRAVPVTLHVSDVPLQSVLPRLAEQVGYLITIPEGSKAIVVSENKAAAPRRAGLPDAQMEVPLQMTINGKVTDSLGLPLQGVTVQVVGTNRQTSTNANGFYELAGVPQDASLLFRLLSYETFEIPADRPVINVVLKYLISFLDEPEVRGYYSTTRRLSTGNVSTVTASEIAKQPVGNPIATLQGRIPGVFIEQQSGVPGKSWGIEIRGRNSIANGNDPLYIIDGVPFPSQSLSTEFFTTSGRQSPLNSINPADIESISILKDADATAIYGSMGANGVVLITTKKGSVGKTQVDANFYTGWGKVTRFMDMLNTEQYLEMRNEALRNDNREPGANEYDVNGVWDQSRYTDWQKILIGNTARTSDAQLRFSGGNSQTRYTLGGGYRRETSIFPGESYDKRLSLQSSFTHLSADGKFRANFSFSYSNNTNDMPSAQNQFARYIVTAPNAPAIYDADGNLNWENGTWNNPFVLLEKKDRTSIDNMLTNGSIAYTLLPGLTFNTGFGFNMMKANQNIIQPSTSYAPANQRRPELRINQNIANELRSWIIEPQLEYEKQLGTGVINILVGTTFRESDQRKLAQTASNFPSDDLIENISAAGNITVNNFSDVKYRYHAFYGRVGYNLDDKYILNLTGRRDGSSRFGPGKQFGNFGSVGAAWIFSNEEGLKGLSPVLSFGKIRGSYGVTGNDQLTDYQYLSTYSSLSFIYLNSSGLYPTRLSNPDFGWESVKKMEAALELGFWNNKLMFTATWYRNRTGNQLVGYPLPQITGFGTVQANLPAVIQNKGLEFEVTATVGKDDRLTWTTSANVSIPRNKLVSYPDIESSSYNMTYQVGKSMYGSYRFEYTGVDPQTGWYTFRDKDDDGSISYANDRTYTVVDKSFHGGLNNTLNYRQWSLSFLFDFTKQEGEIFYNAGPPGSSNINQNIRVLDRWQEVGDTDKSVERFNIGTTTTQTLFDLSNGNVGDASYMRLRNLSFAWSAPKTLFSLLPINNFRVYLQAQNLWTLTRYKGVDPETGPSFAIPPIRMITAGVQVTL